MVIYLDTASIFYFRYITSDINARRILSILHGIITCLKILRNIVKLIFRSYILRYSHHNLILILKVIHILHKLIICISSILNIIFLFP